MVAYLGHVNTANIHHFLKLTPELGQAAMMEDGPLMLGPQVCKWRGLLPLDAENGIKSKPRVQMYRINPEALARMLECNRQHIHRDAKIIVRTFESSSISDSEAGLTNYYLRWEGYSSGGCQAQGIENTEL
jgi:hypothetical protein